MTSKICLLEPTLGAELVGHAAYARDFASWLNKRGYEVTICARRELSDAVVQFVGAHHKFIKVFSHPFINWSLLDNPQADWRSREKLTREMVAAIEATHDHDAQICSTAFPNLAYAALKAKRRAPRVNFLFHYSLQQHSDSHLMTDPAVLKKLQNPREHGVYCIANNLSLACELNELGIPTRTAPYIHYVRGPKPAKNRMAKAALNVGIFGHQRARKDGGLLEPLCRSLLDHGYNVTFHDSSGDKAPFEHPNFTFISGFLEPETFSRLIATVDLTIITNKPEGFDRAISGVCIESLANAVPCVVPSNTHMSRIVYKFGAGTTYTERSVDNIIRHVQTTISDFTIKAEGALVASKWLRHYRNGGAAAYFESLSHH